MIIVDGRERKLDIKLISDSVEKYLSKFSSYEKAYIKEVISYLIDDMECDKKNLRDLEPEEYMTLVVKRYLIANSFDQLYTCADYGEIYEYTY